MNISFSKILVISAMGLSALSLQGCTDEDVALGSGLVAGVIIGSAGARHHDRGSGYDRGYGNGYDRGYDGGYDNGYGRGRRRHYGSEVLSESAGAQVIKDSPVEIIAANYNISEFAAQKVLTSLTSAKNGNIAALQEIGLSKNDLIALMKGENLSAGTIDQVSAELEMSSAEARLLMADVKADVKAASAKPATPSYIPGH